MAGATEYGIGISMSSPSSSTALSDTLAEGLFQVHNQELLRSIVDNLSEGVIVSDATGNLLYYSPAALEFQGMGQENMSAEEWRGHFRITDADTGQPLVGNKVPLSRALRGEENATANLRIEASHFTHERNLHVSARPLKDRDGKILGALLFMRDTTRERQAEAERRRSERSFRLIVEAAQEGIWTLDTELRTNYVNQYMADMLGYTVQEMLGRPVLEFVAEDSREDTLVHMNERRQGVSRVHDRRLRHKAGHAVWVLISSNPMRDDEGHFVGVLGTVTDITQRREAEQQVLQLNETLERRIAERTAQLEFSNRELEAFAYSVAHDLRAPLRSISNFTLALTEDCAGQLDATGQDYLQRVRGASQRMSELIDGILSLSRVSRTELQSMDVNLSALARSISEQLQRWQPERTARFSLQEGLVDQGDPNLLRSVLENLLGNAWKFTRERAVAEITFGVLPQAGAQRVYFVRDNGAGFDMEYQAKLFGVFQRLHTQQEFEGTGVGLATVQRILRRHGGRVWGEGHVGQGATFFFTLHDPTEAPHG